MDELPKDLVRPDTSAITYQQILNNMLSKKDIELKTEINQPYDFTKLKALSYYYRSLELTDWAELLDFVMDFFMLIMTSNKRERSKEIIKALSNIEKETVEGFNKLTTNLK